MIIIMYGVVIAIVICLKIYHISVWKLLPLYFLLRKLINRTYKLYFKLCYVFYRYRDRFLCRDSRLRCLANYHRSHMFQECRKCGQGLECKDDYATLKPGYWWNWRNKSFKDRYQNFIKNLLTSTPALGEGDVQYPHPIPTPYRCPLEESCEGGLDSRCKIGYKGPLCSVCSSGY